MAIRRKPPHPARGLIIWLILLAILVAVAVWVAGSVEERLQPIVEAFPRARIMVRTFDRRHMLALKGLGLAWIQRELYDSAIVMGRQALTALGIAGREVDRVEQEYRSRDRERLRVQHESGNLRTGLERSFTHAPLED